MDLFAVKAGVFTVSNALHAVEAAGTQKEFHVEQVLEALGMAMDSLEIDRGVGNVLGQGLAANLGETLAETGINGYLGSELEGQRPDIGSMVAQATGTLMADSVLSMAQAMP